jgi:hypothetical protein
MLSSCLSFGSLYRHYGYMETFLFYISENQLMKYVFCFLVFLKSVQLGHSSLPDSVDAKNFWTLGLEAHS